MELFQLKSAQRIPEVKGQSDGKPCRVKTKQTVEMFYQIGGREF